MENVYLYSWHDAIAFALFAVSWIGYSLATDGHMIKRQSLNVLMNKERVNWMKVMTTRELRVIDTSIIAGLQQGTAFFASTSVFAIGGCFALMNASDQVIIPVHFPPITNFGVSREALSLHNGIYRPRVHRKGKST